MIKRLIGIMLCLIMVMSLFGNVSAQNNYTLTQDIQKGFELLSPDISFMGDEYVSVIFDVKNTLWTTVNADIDVIVASEGKVVSQMSFNRNIGYKTSTCIWFSGRCGENTTITISVKNPYARNEIYVSNDGNDNNVGSSEKPLKTIYEAFDRLGYEMDEEYYAGEDVSVILKNGEYEIDRTLVIDDFVTKSFNTFTLKAENQGGAVLKGGVTLKGEDFNLVADEATLSKLSSSVHGKVFSYDLSKAGLSFDFSNPSSLEPMAISLFYNDEWQTISRYPNNERMQAETTTITSNVSSLVRRITVTDTDIDEAHKTMWKSADLSEAWLNSWLFWDWEQNKGVLSSVTDTGVTFDLKTSRGVDYTRNNGTYYVYNLLCEIDIPGEYAYLDNILYFYPSEEDVADGSFFDNEIILNCDSHNLISVESDNVKIENLTFKNARGRFISANSDYVSILGCEFYNSSSLAIAVNGNNNLVSSCDFHELGGCGASVTGGDVNTLTHSNSVIENCRFDNNGIVSRTGSAAFSLGGVGVSARNNTITRCPHSAISYSGNYHIIEYNDMSQCLTDNSGDAGIIYTGRNLANIGTLITHNYIHHSNSGLGSIYWDDRLSGQRANNNVFEGIERALFIHAGICNSFNNNIVIKKENASHEKAVAFRGRTYNVEDISETYNLWFTQPFLDGVYSHTNNTLLAHLLGSDSAALGGRDSYPGVPWQSAVWQNAFSVGSATDSNINIDENYMHVLNYVDYKQTRKIEETSIRDNYFVGFTSQAVSELRKLGVLNITYLVDGIIQCNLSKSSSDFIDAATEIASTGNEKGTLTGDRLSQYNDVVNNSGIYINEYRTSLD